MMRRFGVAVLVALGAAAFGGGVAHAALQPAGPAPASVTCFASATGAVGPTGVAGQTGPKGPVGESMPPNGPARPSHLRGKLPDCSSIAGICLEHVNPGLRGATGATGPVGPKGDTGHLVGGRPRMTHVRQVVPCEGFPLSCHYGLRGPDGATGATGPEGAKGDIGFVPINGPQRASHRRPAGGVVDQPSNASVTLAGCDLPETGGSATPALPYALLLVALGGLVVLVAERRRSVLRR